MRKLLVVVDMQNDFIDGALGTKEAEGIVENVKAKIREYAPDDVFATRDTHHEDYLSTQEGKYLPVPHCIQGTDGWQIRPDIADLLTANQIVDKPTFGSTDLAEKIATLYDRENGDLSVELCGLCTDICVVSNALLLKATRPEMSIEIDSSCCAGVTPEKHEAALETMRSCQVQVK